MLKALTYLTKISTTTENYAVDDYGKRKKLWHDQTSAFTIKPTPIADTNDSRTSMFLSFHRNLTSFELSVRRRNRNPKDTTDVINNDYAIQ
jgi:hypothetical protein